MMIGWTSGDNSAKCATRRTIVAATVLVALLNAIFSATRCDAKQKQPRRPVTHQSIETPNGKGARSAPKAADPAKADKAAQVESWTDAEIADARAHCAVVLQRIHAVAIPHAPIREGACGAPAPVELLSVGQSPQVVLSPPAIVRCDLVEQLAHWLENDVQPLARKHLKSAIVRIDTMSSYSCRNAYGRKSTKLSEHALANALDIGGFVTASAANADVLDDWGKPQREIAAEAALRKKAAEDAAAKTAETGIAGNPVQGGLPAFVPATTAAAVVGLARATIIEGAPNTTDVAKTALNSDASRLGGPSPQPAGRQQTPAKTAFFSEAKPLLANPPPEMKAFLHDVHETACRRFGTTLGPEANVAHRNHFHVDMAPRKFRKICD